MPEPTQTVEVLTFGAIWKLALTTGLATAIFNQLLGWLKEIYQLRDKDARSGKALALLLVECLTKYAQECNHRLGYNAYDRSFGDHGRYSDMPGLPPYPEGAGWEVLPAKISAGLRDLRNEVDEATRSIKISFEVVGPEDGIDTATHKYGAVGYTALKISERLRAYYKLGPYQAAGQSSFASELLRHYRESHPGPVRRLWESLPVYKMRRCLSKCCRKLLKLFRLR